MADLSIAEPLAGIIECPMDTSIKPVNPQLALDYPVQSAI